jgi:Leucine-rich repeat (LRR) protein
MPFPDGHIEAIRNNKTSIAHLELASFDLLDEDMVDLISVLSSPDTTIESINLSENKITDAGTASLAIAVSSIPRLKELDLSYNEITAVGAGYFADTTLEELHLSHNAIGDEGARALSTSKMKKLGLRSCGITDVGAASLSKGTFGSLLLTTNQVTTTGLTGLLQNSFFKVLHVDYNRIEAIVPPVPLIGGEGRLRTLVLSHNQISRIDQEFSDTCSGLRQLSLGYNLFDDSAAAIIATILSLEWLSLRHNSISDVGASTLMQTDISNIDLRENSAVTDPTLFCRRASA